MVHQLFQSTLPAWGATCRLAAFAELREISIHAPRVGSDAPAESTGLEILDFNPRSPRGERLLEVLDEHMECVFQSTLPAWGATGNADRPYRSASGFQSTLPAWGATLSPLNLGADIGISIHAPRVGSDCLHLLAISPAATFQSTLPAWGATNRISPQLRDQTISIHAPRVGSDISI